MSETTQVAEVVTFRLLDGADPAAFVSAAAAIDPILRKSGAVLGRTLSMDDDGLWTDHIVWTRLEIGPDSCRTDDGRSRRRARMMSMIAPDDRGPAPRQLDRCIKRSNMRRSDRLFDIIQILRDGKLHRAQDIAARLEVSTRTIYRDMDTLVGSGVPVEGERGVGYMITEAISLPPLTLTAAAELGGAQPWAGCCGAGRRSGSQNRRRHAGRQDRRRTARPHHRRGAGVEICGLSLCRCDPEPEPYGHCCAAPSKPGRRCV